MSFPSTCLHQAQVCRSIIPQLLSPLMESLPTNLRSFAPDTHHSTTGISSTPSHPCKALSLSRNQFLSCLKSTSSLFPTFHNFSSLPSFLAPSRPASFNQYSSRTNANKQLRIHHHLRVRVSLGLYFTYLMSLKRFYDKYWFCFMPIRMTVITQKYAIGV